MFSITFLAIEPRTAALGFIAALGLLTLVALLFLLRSLLEQRKYSKAALPSMGGGSEVEETTLNPAESAFALDGLDDLPPISYGGAEGDGGNLHSLPGLAAHKTFDLDGEEEFALPSLSAPAPTPTALSEPVMVAHESEAVAREPIASPPEAEEVISAQAPEAPEKKSKEARASRSLFRSRKPISIPTPEEETAPAKAPQYVGKRRLGVPVESNNATKEEQ